MKRMRELESRIAENQRQKVLSGAKTRSSFTCFACVMWVIGFVMILFYNIAPEHQQAEFAAKLALWGLAALSFVIGALAYALRGSRWAHRHFPRGIGRYWRL
jgi:uncharacterized membrane protein